MSVCGKYVWNTLLLHQILSDETPIKSISALKSYIEADEPELLLEAINNNHKAKIFTLLCCFTYTPSAKCIEYLIANGTPLDRSFEGNPFESTPKEYLDKYFGFTANKLHTKARNTIYQAIEKGKASDIPKEKVSNIKKVGQIILSSLTRK